MIYPDGEPGAVLTLIAEEEERRKAEEPSRLEVLRAWLSNEEPKPDRNPDKMSG